MQIRKILRKTRKEHIMNKQSMPNRSNILTETEILFHDNGSDNESNIPKRYIPAKAKVFMELEPEPQIVIECQSESSITGLYLNNILNNNIYLKGTILEEDKEFILCNNDPSDPTKFSCTLRPPEKLTIWYSKENEFSSAEFSVLNCPKLEKHTICITKPTDNNEWEINISRMQDSQKTPISNQINNIITHTGTIRQCDGSNFSKEQADELLEGIEWFLWFARSSACGIINIKGKDNNDQIVFEEYTIKTASSVSQSKLNRSLRSKFGSVSLCLFPYFWELYKSHKEMLPTIIHLYAENNENEIQEICIILNQIALDMLSHMVLGCEYKSIRYPIECSPVKNNICIEIPSETYPELAKFAQENNYKNSIHAMTDIRNASVHYNPNDKIKIQDVPISVKMAVAELGHIYIEQMLLKLSGCNGGYNTLEDILAKIKRLNPPRK